MPETQCLKRLKIDNISTRLFNFQLHNRLQKIFAVPTITPPVLIVPIRRLYPKNEGRRVMPSENAKPNDRNEPNRLSDKDVVQIGELLKSGRIPLKLVTGEQNTGRVTVMPGAIHAEENAIVIFVCG
jgi:hypothetical protein